MDESLIKLLEQSGFTEKEARVYLALLQFGQGDVTEVAKIADLKRSIIYVLLEGLIKRGYVSELPNKKPSRFQAIDPAMILNQLKTVIKNFSEMLPIFRTLRNEGKNRPKIFYHETREAISKEFTELGKEENNFFISSYKKIDRYLPGETEKWIEDYKKGIISTKGHHLVGNNPFDLEVGRKLQKEVEQKVRYLPDVKEFNMDFAICGNKLAITCLEENPFMVIVESKELIQSIKILFEIAWEKGKDIDK